MNKQIFKSTVIEIKSSDDGREITAIASLEKIDRDGDIIRIGNTPSEGIDIREYKKNSVVLFSHNPQQIIGKATKIWKEGKKLFVKILFADGEVSSLADSVYKLIKGGFLKTLSIGFSPNWETAERMKDSRGWDFKNTQLYEISLVSVPSNSGATILSKAVEDGVIDQLELDEIKLNLSEQTNTNDTKDIDEVVELKAKVAELELLIKEQDMEEETEGNIYKELYDEFSVTETKDIDVLDEYFK